jgi:hypothetical protein
VGNAPKKELLWEKNVAKTVLVDAQTVDAINPRNQ